MNFFKIQFYYPFELICRVEGDCRKELLKPFLKNEILPKLEKRVKYLENEDRKFSILNFETDEENLAFLMEFILNKERTYFPYAISCKEKNYSLIERFLKEKMEKKFYLDKGIYGKQFNFRKIKEK